MNGSRSCFRSRCIAVCLILVTVFSCCTLTAAAAPTSDDGIISGLLSGWSSSTSPTYYSSSWFWQVLVELRDIDTTLSGTFSDLKSGWSGTSLTTPTGYSNSWYASVRNLLYGIDGSLDLVQPAVTNIDLDLDTLKLKSSSIEGYLSNYFPTFSSHISSIKSNVLLMSDYVADMKTKVTSLDNEVELLSQNVSGYLAEIQTQSINQTSYLTDISSSAESIDSGISSLDSNLEWLCDYFSDPTEESVKNKMRQSLFQIDQAGKKGYGWNTSYVNDLFDISSFFIEDAEFSSVSGGLYDLLSGLEVWFSDTTYFALQEGAGSAALVGYSTYSRFSPDPTPLLDENVSKINDWLGDLDD